ncbi:unnamed protein product [Urochloa humidicola]
MAFGATALKVATVAAIFMALVLSSEAGRKSAATGTPCKEKECISKCPSKCHATADKACEGYKKGPSRECYKGCEFDCHGKCGSDAACHATCPDPKCVKKCEGTPWPEYKPCLTATFEGCKKECVAGCKGEKVQG